MTPVVIFDIETVPDVTSGKRMNPKLAELSDQDALSAMIAIRQDEVGSNFMRLPLHKIACLSMLWVDDNQMKLKSFSLDQMDEAQILNTFFGIFKKERLPNLVSWNGSGFDIPVMLYRAMHHRLSAPDFLNELGDMKYNNYLSRYHTRHLDLMDKLTLYAGYNRQSLDTVAGICGFAGKQDIDGSMVVDLVEKQNWQALTTYCESDVLNTWLVYLRWQLLTGILDLESESKLEIMTKEYVANIIDQGNIRHQGFLDGWV